MASLGELAAVIAHEIQNSLNFINNFSDINNEMKIEVNAGDKAEVLSIADHVKENMKDIYRHGKCADAIVKNMLQHYEAVEGKKMNLPTLLL